MAIYKGSVFYNYLYSTYLHKCGHYTNITRKYLPRHINIRTAKVMVRVNYIDNNTPFHFIFDWGVSYWPRADDKEHNFAWRLHICQRAECLPEGFSPRANTEPEGKCVAWGRNYVLFPWEQGQYETPRSNLKWKGVLLFIVHPYHYFKTTKLAKTSYRDAVIILVV